MYTTLKNVPKAMLYSKSKMFDKKKPILYVMCGAVCEYMRLSLNENRFKEYKMIDKMFFMKYNDTVHTVADSTANNNVTNNILVLRSWRSVYSLYILENIHRRIHISDDILNQNGACILYTYIYLNGTSCFGFNWLFLC